jgi:hypothetical protein
MQPIGFGLSARSATDAVQYAFHVAEKRNLLNFVFNCDEEIIK